MLIRCLQGLALGSVAVSSALAAQPQPVLVAAQGDPAPGSSGVFHGISGPEINDAGEIAFRASLGGNVADENDRGVWVFRDEVLTPVVIEGQALPGLAGAVVTGIGDWKVLESGVAVAVQYDLDGIEGGALLIDRTDDVVMRLLSGPGVALIDGREVVNAGFTLDINNAGDLLYGAGLVRSDGSGSDTVIVVERDGVAEVVYNAEAGLPTSNGLTSLVQFPRIMLTEEGAAVLVSQLEPTGGGVIAGENDWGVWIDRGDGLARVFAGGSQLGGVSAIRGGSIAVIESIDVVIIDADNNPRRLLDELPALPGGEPIGLFVRGWFETEDDFNAVIATSPGGIGNLTVRDGEVQVSVSRGDVLGGVLDEAIFFLGVPQLNAQGTGVARTTTFGLRFGELWFSSWPGIPVFSLAFETGDVVRVASNPGRVERIFRSPSGFNELSGTGSPYTLGGSGGISTRSGFRSPRRELNENNQFVTLVMLESGVDAVVVVDLERPCVADVNGDGVVSGADFSAWLDAFNNQTRGSDQNGDGFVNALDFGAWLTNFNAGCD